MNSHPLDAITVIDSTDHKKILGMVTRENLTGLLERKEEKDGK
jgi:hypothetical protein